MVPVQSLLLAESDFFARFEPNRFTWRYGHLVAGSWVPADSTLARFDYEDSETSQFDTFASLHRALESLKHGVDGALRLDFCYSHLVRDSPHNILFDHSVTAPL